MRELTSHLVNGVNKGLRIDVVDEPGPGGAHHEYAITIVDGERVLGPTWNIKFQNGPIAEVGTNGLTHEALLAVCIDRLECFQNGPFACAENAVALAHLRLARNSLQARTQRRIAQGVEGTLTPGAGDGIDQVPAVVVDPASSESPQTATVTTGPEWEHVKP